MTAPQGEYHKHHCEVCEKDYYARKRVLNFDGMDEVQIMMAKKDSPEMDYLCPDCGNFGLPYNLLNAKVNIFEKVSGPWIFIILGVTYYINGKWIEPLLMHLFGLYDFMAEMLTWLTVSPIVTLGMFFLVCKITSKRLYKDIPKQRS
jgi:hypothetical protein